MNQGARQGASQEGVEAGGADHNSASPCANPQRFGPDPKFQTVEIRDIQAYGIDFDGRHSRANATPAGGTCTHNDLVGMNGERGIDNQFYRALGCVKGYQPTSHGNSFAIEMQTGSWGILITLSGIDDIRNDEDVEVGFFANADPIELSATREPLPYATYAIDQDPRFRATARGRIANGVLTTDPVDVRFHKVTNSMYLERTLVDAEAKMTVGEDGTLEGYLAGYTPVDEMYDFEFAYRNGKNAKGESAGRLVALSSRGRAANLGYTCNGVYYALHELADGHPDPTTGKCTSISTQYRIRAIPAFVVDVRTESLNKRVMTDELDAKD
jgi:hypothetical protein